MRMAHLRVGSLGEHGPYCVGVASEGVNARFGTHIPHLHEQVHTIQSLTIVAYTVVCTLAVESLLPVTRTSMVG